MRLLHERSGTAGSLHPITRQPRVVGVRRRGAAAKQPEAHEAPTPPRDDGRTQLYRTLDALKQPGANAEKDTQAAQSVVDAIRGATQMQSDAGLKDH